MEPIILADNRFLDGTVEVSGTATGFAAANIVDLRPYTFWQAEAAGENYCRVDCGAVLEADCLGVIGHNLHSAGALVSVETSSDGVTWLRHIDPFTPSSDRAFLKPFVLAAGIWWRLKIVTETVAPFVAVALIGKRLQFPYPPDGGVPFTESVQEESAQSKTGQPLGTVVRYFPVEVRKDFSHVPREWVDGDYLSWWRDYGRYRKYFFWAEDLDVFPDEVFFVKHSGKFAPTATNRLYYDKLSLELQGVAEP